MNDPFTALLSCSSGGGKASLEIVNCRSRQMMYREPFIHLKTTDAAFSHLIIFFSLGLFSFKQAKLKVGGREGILSCLISSLYKKKAATNAVYVAAVCGV